MDNPNVPALRRLRKAAGLTLKQLSDLSGVNIRQIQRVEGGESDAGNITLKNATALSAVLGVEPAELLDAPAPDSEAAAT